MATRDNQFTLGNANNTYTTPGITSQASRNAQSGDVEIVTSDASGNLATSGINLRQVLSLGTTVESNTAAIANNSRAISNNKSGIAMAMALDAPYVPADKQFAISTGIGSFEGSEALAVSMGFRINPNTQFDAGVTYGFDNDQVGGRIGMTYAW